MCSNDNIMMSVKIVCMILGICSPAIRATFASNKPRGLEVVVQWSQLEFDYASDIERQEDIDNGIFVPGIPAPIDTDVYYSHNDNEKKVFVSIPRFQSGVPVTLGFVTNRQFNGNPIIAPYPSWDWHKNPQKCRRDRIVSVYRVMVDECGRLWVLDTGKLLDSQICPPQILTFDLRTNTLVHRYEVPASQLESDSLLVTPVVDIRDGQCGNTFVYAADCIGNSIIVYDAQRNRSWRVSHRTMYPYPNYGTYNIQGESFELMDGVLGMSLSPQIPGKDRKLYYHAMSSSTENWVYTSYLRNQSLFEDDPSSSPRLFNTYRDGRGTQSAAEAMSKDGIMFFGLMSDVKIACYNTRGQYMDIQSTDIVADNPVTLQFASGVKVVGNKNGEEELWILTSRFQKVATGTLNPAEINFRIQVGKVNDLLAGTTCGMGKRPYGYGNNHPRPSGGYGFQPPRNQYN
ncbi:unnamed protein product [Phaedon cochleariae]|uniref:Yellow-like protein n=1 Tax=Phaedon cochleariae TaxID=80249 RepID=A0A9P0D7R4_PHACE|nr:unnamed protein product [Phaedon cochleariae]